MKTSWLRWPTAVVAGLATGFSFQPYDLWPLIFLGVAGLTLAVYRAPLRRAVAFGYLFGLAMLGISVSWLHVLGIWIAVALVVFESLFFALLGLALALLTRFRWWPLSATLAWAACEFSYSREPFGGFGWTRIAYSQVDGPLAGWFPLVGVAGVSALTAGVGQTLAWLVLSRPRGWTIAGSRSTGTGSSRAGRSVGLTVLALAVVATSGGLLRSWAGPGPAAGSGSVRVAVVQGNVPGRGIQAMGRARTVTENHLSQTIAMIAAARLGRTPMPDFVLWPENSTDIDPTRDVITRTVVESATRIAGLPILVGAVMEGPGPDERQTSALWWDPQRGVLARYDKRNLVPFGEWIPFRRQLLPLLPILREVGAQSVPGTTPGVLRVPISVGGSPRQLAVGDVICFELAYDRTVYQAVRGSQVLMVQSNNATYGGTGQIEQQFAITRARAMEARREIAVATTDSVSGLVDRTGRVSVRTRQFTSASIVVNLPSRTALTPAIRVGRGLDQVLALTAAIWLAAATLRMRRGSGARASTRRRVGGMSQDGLISRSATAGRAGSRPEDRKQSVS